MAATTISRATWTDDSGTPTSPVGDGTIINNDRLQNDIYAKIDEMFAGAGSYTTFTLGGLLSVEGFGIHLFSAGGTGPNEIIVRNTTAGAGNISALALGNDNDPSNMFLWSFSSTYSGSGHTVASGGLVAAQGSGGLALVAAHASGQLRLYGGGTSLGAMLDSSGMYIYNPSGALQAFTVVGRLVSTVAQAFGAGVGGTKLKVERNTSGSGAPGTVLFIGKDGSAYYIWMTTAGLLRTSSSEPTESAGDAIGTAIGDQSASWYAVKTVRGLSDAALAVARIRAARVFDWTYRDSTDQAADGSPTVFSGFVGYERDDWFLRNTGPGQDPALNVPTVVGHLTLTMQHVLDRLDLLEQRAV